MDLMESVKYPTQDENWILKLIIGAVLTLVGGILSVVLIGLPLIFVTYGYLVRVASQVLAGNNHSLPEWDDWGGDFVRGAVVLGASILYFLPMFIVLGCSNLMLAMLGDNADGIALLIICLAMPISLLYSLVASPMLAAGFVAYAGGATFKDAFLDFGARFREIRNNLGTTGMYVLLAMIISFVMGLIASLTFWLCGLGLVISWWSYVSLAHLTARFGQELRTPAF